MPDGSETCVCIVCDYLWDPEPGDDKGVIPPGVLSGKPPDDRVFPRYGGEKDPFGMVKV
jgi:rubredoxin